MTNREQQRLFAVAAAAVAGVSSVVAISLFLRSKKNKAPAAAVVTPDVDDRTVPAAVADETAAETVRGKELDTFPSEDSANNKDMAQTDTAPAESVVERQVKEETKKETQLKEKEPAAADNKAEQEKLAREAEQAEAERKKSARKEAERKEAERLAAENRKKEEEEAATLEAQKKEAAERKAREEAEAEEQAKKAAAEARAQEEQQQKAAQQEKAEEQRKKEDEPKAPLVAEGVVTPTKQVVPLTPPEGALSPSALTPPSLRFNSPAKSTLAVSTDRMIALGMSLPSIEGFESKTGNDTNGASASPTTVAHFPLLKHRYVNPSAGAELILLAEDLSLVAGPVDTKAFMASSIEALSALEGFDSGRLEVLHTEPAKNLIVSSFDDFSDLIVQHKGGAHNSALYVASLYKVIGRTGYIFQLQVPLLHRERFVPLFYDCGQKVEFDEELAIRAPLRGRLQFYVEHPTSHKLYELRAPGLEYLERSRYSPTNSPTAAKEAQSTSLSLLSLVSRYNEANRVELRAESDGTVKAVLSIDEEDPKNNNGTNPSSPSPSSCHNRYSLEDISDRKGTIVSRGGWYRSPILEFPLPNRVPATVVEHRFGDGLLSMILHYNHTDAIGKPDDEDEILSKDLVFADLTIGFLFCPLAEAQGLLSAECVQNETFVCQPLQDHLYEHLVSSGPVVADSLIVKGTSRVLGDDYQLRFTAIETQADECLVVRWTLPQRLIEREDALQEYMSAFTSVLRLIDE